ncbi:MAG: tetratricopeptide repeat protein [Candidatus Kapabacteria bacterium]|nr:tetratricopeptide repeat protein [Candidatus Kapabacteria bacterium]
MNARLKIIQDVLADGGMDYADSDDRMKLLLEAAYILANHDNIRAHDYALEALRYARSSGDTMLELESALAVAVVSAQAAQFDEALPRFFQISKQAEMLQAWHVQASALRWTAVCYVRIAMFTTALEYLAKARAVADEHALELESAKIYNTSGDAYFGLGEAQTALQHYREALRMLEGMSDADERASALFSIAAAHKELRGYSQARLYFEQALAAYKHAGNISGVSRALIGVSEMYAEQERFDKALELLFVALEIGERELSAMERSQVLLVIGDVYFRAGRAEKALDYLRRAEEGLQGTQALAIVARVHELLSQCYKATGDIERAFSNLERFHALREQTALQDGKRTIQYLQQGFAAEQAQKESEIYRLRNVELAHAQQELERLLLNILPMPIAQRLRAGESTIADTFENVTVVFVDIVGFTRLAGMHSAEDIVRILDDIFSVFDAITEQYSLEKIKTIGDAYMIAAGIPYPRRDHVEAAIKAALDMLSAVEVFSERMMRKGFDSTMNIRIGMHTGSVVAGIIGTKKFAYDLWGDTVNTASRMESHGEAGKIHISEEVYTALKSSSEQGYEVEERGEIEIKGKGNMRTYFIVGKTPEKT